MLLDFEIFSTSPLLVSHSKTDWSSMLRESVSVEWSVYIDTDALFKVGGRSLVKTENNNGPCRLPYGTPHTTEMREDSINENRMCSTT